MKESTLVKLSLLCSISGLLLLFIFSLFIDVQETNIVNLQDTTDKDVRIRGKIIGIKVFDNLALIEIAEIRSANVVVFDKRMLKYGIGDNISVSGELRDYKGKKEIIAERIRVIK